MPDDKLIHHPTEVGRTQIPAAGPPTQYVGEPLYDYGPVEEEEQGLDWRRYLFAIARYKWLLVLALVLGSAGAAYVWRTAEFSYRAEGNLWIEVERRGSGDVAPIQTSGLLDSSAWIELLRSFAVLDSVAIAERLYVTGPAEFEEAFARLALGDRFAPGGYLLSIDASGRDYALSTAEGVVIERGVLGDPIGEALGFVWRPSAGAFPPQAEVEFSVTSPRAAARSLGNLLGTRMDRQGNFLAVSLTGENPERTASILNTVMERHVVLAAELKRAKLDETLVILEEQLRYTEAELAQAEQELEEFRITTITLPTDAATPINPGIELTTGSVFGNFFGMNVELEATLRDRVRLQEVLEGFRTQGVSIAALEAIPSAAGSTELSQALNELVDVRSQLRVLQDRYSDDFPPVQELLTRIESLEGNTIPRMVTGLVAELGVQTGQMQALVNSASAELAAIPPRTIEEGRLTRRVGITENLYNNLRSRVETARLAAASSIPDIRILDRAETPEAPIGDERIRLAAMILLGCLGAALGGAILLDRVDARFRYAADVSRDIGLDILGSVPRIKPGTGIKGASNAAHALEAFRELRIHVGFAYGSAGPLTLTITSPSEAEGKSLISSNLAVAFAEVGKRTLLIDGDTRRGDAHRLLGLQRTPGLIDYLKEQSGADIVQTTDIKNLDFIGSGSRGTSTPELLASSRMAMFMGTLKTSYDVIIVDSPPLASGGDPLILSSLTGNLAVVIRTGSTEKQLAQAKLDQLSRLPIRILGAILNDVDPNGSGYGYYSSTYLPNYQPVEEDGEEDSVQLLSGSQAS